MSLSCPYHSSLLSCESCIKNEPIDDSVTIKEELLDYDNYGTNQCIISNREESLDYGFAKSGGGPAERKTDVSGVELEDTKRYVNQDFDFHYFIFTTMVNIII